MPQNKKAKRKRAPLLILETILLILGLAAILAPVLEMELALRRDTEEYEQFSAKSRAVSEQSSLDPAALDLATMSEMVFAASSPIGAGRTGIDLAACKAENADFIAWIQIPGTTVDYPVVLSNETEYYLNHTFSGRKSYLGTLFSLGKTDYCTPGKNIAIYGHHIRSNGHAMFSPLISYKEQSFYAGHQTIYLDSLYYSDTYIVFAVINMRSGDWDLSSASFATDDDFLRYVQRAKAQSLYETGVEVNAKDQVLTLITCDRSYIPTYGRLVVMAVRLQPDDVPQSH